MDQDHVMTVAVQNSEGMARAVACAFLVVCTFASCTERPEGVVATSGEDCRDLVRGAIEQADLLTTPAAKDSIYSAALETLGANPPPNCEWRLLWEQFDQEGNAAAIDQVIRIGQRLLSLERYLSTDQRVRVKFKLAQAYFELGSPRSFDLAKDVFLELDSLKSRSPMMFQATDLLVNTYDLTGELEECSILLQNALVKAQKENDPLWTGELLDRAGDLYVRQKKYREALSTFEAGMALLNSLEYSGTVRDTLWERGVDPARSDERNGERTSEENSALRKAPRLLTIRDQLLLRQRIRHKMGAAFLATDRLGDAKTAYFEALSLANGPLVGMVEAPYVELGELAFQEGNMAEAMDQGQRGLDQARAKTDPDGIRNAAILLYRANKERGDMSKALAMSELARSWTDSIGGSAFALALQKKQVLYEVRDDSLQMAEAYGREQLERRNAQLEAKSNRTLAWASAGVGLVLLAGSGFWFVTDRKRRRERHDRESAQLETQALRSQMNPHFIFNALNSINAYVQENDQDSASTYLIKFARVMRAVLENSRHTEVSLKEDLDALRGYMELERMRMQNKFDFSIEVASNLDSEEVLVPPLVVQPFVENAIWHGMSGKEGKGHISLRVDRREGQLVWTIEDDGIGRNGTKATEPAAEDQNTATKKTSLGTAITRARLDLVERQYGGTAGFRYIDLPQGTRVEVDLPLLLA
jgi:anti-sigma regulatory factor (Ser/Thr protein kinase)/tetratricopeptide (TPR) repeat protein